MPILKHVEYMICCDDCYASLTDYEPREKSKRSTVNYLEKSNNIKKVNGKYLCNECINAIS